LRQTILLVNGEPLAVIGLTKSKTMSPLKATFTFMNSSFFSLMISCSSKWSQNNLPRDGPQIYNNENVD